MVTVLQHNGEVVVKGIIINHHFGILKEYLEEYVKTNKHIKLNLKELEFIDENGAMELMTLAGKMKQQGINFEITSISDKVMNKFIQLGAKIWLGKNLFSKVG
ncbi:STAS domain-containing protein [Desulfolucanica intricata]|uniref:STAS domain-containing protein n=1 Tax=Desulfolucanica intricata TaxID=1285191 RepID=UPI000831FBDB|nr:STAS domain-containing protein [Desulfolucanica intricata]